MPEQEASSKTKGTRRRRRLVVALASVLVLAVMATAGATWWLTDRPVTAPGWLRDRIEARIALNAPGMRVDFGEMQITVHHGWRPKVRLRNVTFETDDGRPLLALSELQATLAMRPLLKGLVQPRTAALSGIFATLRRDRDGQLSLVASTDATAGGRQAATLPELVDQLDDLFQWPVLTALTQLDVDAVTLRLEDARADRAWTVDGARLRVRRERRELNLSADLAILGGGAQAATMAANYTSRIGESEAQFGVAVTDVPASDVAAFTPAFAWLGGLRAPISGALRGGVLEGGALAEVSATFQIGEGALQPTPGAQPVPFRNMQVYFTFDPAQSELVFDHLSVDSAWAKGQLEGRARLVGLETGRLDELIGQFRLSELELDPPGLYPEPRALEGAELDFRLTPDPFRLEIGQMRVIDQGRSMLLDGLLEAGADGWRAALNGRMGLLDPDRLLALWPPGAVVKSRTWVENNLLGGLIRDAQFAVRLQTTRDVVPRPDIHLSFGFENADVRFMKTMPPVTGAKGVASLLRDRFVVAIEAGGVEAPQGGIVDVSGTSFIVPDVTVKGGAPAVVRLDTESTITAALSLLNQEPLQVMTRAGRPVTLADGRAALEINLAMPLVKGLKMDQVEFAVAGDLRDVESTTLAPDRVLASPKLRLAASNSGVEISGDATFDGVPVSATWSQALGPGNGGTSHVSADLELSPDTVETLQIGLPPGTVSGSGRARLELDLAKGEPPAFEVTSDLSGVGLSIPSLGWSLPRGSTGNFLAAGKLGTPVSVDRLELDAPGLGAAGRVSLRAEGGLEAASFERVRLGGWRDAPVRLVGRGKGTPPGVQVTGGTLDLRQANFGGTGGGASGPISLALERLQINDTIALTGFQGDFTVNRGLRGEFRGRVNGQAAVTGQVVPQGGRSAFRIRSADAGAVFAAAGLLKQARGGEMTLTLQPVGTAGAFNGSLSITNTRIKDAPAIAALFNALSVVGLLEQMKGQGLHFAEVEAAFRLTPQQVTLTQASAVGPSIGLSMDGTYDVNRSVLDMRGVFSPIYLINGVGSVLTRKGEGLIGFNFRLTGPAQEPRVQVNPLSALTPSIFREMFRRPPPDVAVEPGESPGATPSLQSGEAPEERTQVAPRGGNR